MQAEGAPRPGPSPRLETDAPASQPVSTAPPRPPRRRMPVPSWLEHRLRTIRDLPEDEPDPAAELRRNFVGYGISALVHLTALLLLSFLIFLLPGEPEPITIDSALGTALGVDEGLEPLGGFDDDLTGQADLAGLDAEALLDPVRPVLELSRASPLVRSGPTGGDAAEAGGGAEFGVAHFGSGGAELVQGVRVKVGDPQFTLIWDGQADIDLHVIEPGGSHIFWERRHGESGGELDVDDMDGFGPENIYWVVDRTDEGEAVKGPGPAGEYRWYVHYYGGHGGFAAPTRWKVRIKLGGTVTIHEGTLRRIDDQSRVFTLQVAPGPDRPTSPVREDGFGDFDAPRRRRP